MEAQTEEKVAAMGPNLMGVGMQRQLTGVSGDGFSYLSPNLELLASELSGEVDASYGKPKSLTLDYDVIGEHHGTLQCHLETEGGSLAGIYVGLDKLDAAELPPNKPLSAETNLTTESSFWTGTTTLKGKTRLSYREGKLIYESVHEDIPRGLLGFSTRTTLRLEFETNPDMTSIGPGQLTVDKEREKVFSKDYGSMKRTIDVSFGGFKPRVDGYVSGWTNRAD